MKESSSEVTHYNKKFENIVYADKHIVNRFFDTCTFYKSALQNCLFDGCTFENCIFEECDLSLIKLKDTAFKGAHFNNCKAIGIHWFDAENPLTIHFNRSNISYSSFFGKNLKKAQFVSCHALEVDFTECNLTQANFKDTELAGAKFSTTDLTQANFVGATNYYINPQINKVKKAKFKLPEALVFLQSLEIIIEE